MNAPMAFFLGGISGMCLLLACMDRLLDLSDRAAIWVIALTILGGGVLGVALLAFYYTTGGTP